MNDFISFPDDSRVWIYSADREIPEELVPEVQREIVHFTKLWTSHREDLRATGGLLHGYFIILIVDENINKPGGCSIDSSVQFIHQLENKLVRDFFNRFIFHYLENERVLSIHSSELAKAYADGSITDQTLFFDPLVKTKQEFQTGWLKPLGESWHKQFLQ